MVDVNLKYRIVGITVLFALAVIFVPMILDGSGRDQVTRVEMDMPTAPKLTFSDDLVQSAKAPAPQHSKSSQPSESALEKIDLVKNTIPEVSVKENNAALSGWVVQVGAFTEQEKAHALQERLAQASFDVFIEIGEKQGQHYYRVKAGPELSKDEALELQAKIANKLSIESGFVTRHPNISSD